jgi:hypothetical protein
MIKSEVGIDCLIVRSENWFIDGVFCFFALFRVFVLLILGLRLFLGTDFLYWRFVRQVYKETSVAGRSRGRLRPRPGK